MVRRLLVALSLAALVLGSTVAPASARSHTASRLPPQKVWRADVSRAMSGSQAALRERVAAAAPGERLAVNLDVDNVSLASQYDPFEPVGPVLRYALLAQRLGVKVFFNTGRRTTFRGRAKRQLSAAGFTVDRLCLRVPGEEISHSKPRCRASFVDAGFTLVANIGNNATDFAGGGYERAYRLPNYHRQLG